VSRPDKLSATTEQNPLLAAALMLAAVFCLSVMDVVFKLLVAHYPSFQVVFFRSAMSWPLFVAWMVFTGRHQFRTHYPLGHLLRGALGVVMLFAVGECFRELQLADAYALFFAAPLLVTLLSGPILGEPAGLVRILAALAGFAGVLIVLAPGSNISMGYGALMGLLGMAAYALSTLLLRKLGSRDGTVTIAFWFVTVVGVVSGLLAAPHWQSVTREWWPELAILGISGTLGQVLLTAAFRKASAAIVAPLDYTAMLWAVVFGLSFWNYLPGWRIWLGSGVIMAMGLFIIYRENRIRQRQLSAARDSAAAP
jgi:drug/metabolite transporter (DMT)-like permease